MCKLLVLIENLNVKYLILIQKFIQMITDPIGRVKRTFVFDETMKVHYYFI